MGAIRRGSLALVVVVLLGIGACGSDDGKKAAPSMQAGEAGQGPENSGAAGGEGGRAGSDGSSGAGVVAAGQGGAAKASSGEPCNEDAECAEGLRCAYEQCIPLAVCGDADACQNDQYCDDGLCVPYALPASVSSNADCARQPVLGPFEVELQCSFETPPDGQLPASNQVMTTPSVADLDFDRDPATHRPSLVFATYASQTWPGLLTGDLRLIDGRTCELLQTLMGDDEQVVSTAQPALADLNGDGRIEIVMPRAPAYGGLIAFSQGDDGKYEKLWTSAVCDDGGGRTADTTNQNAEYMAGVSIHDLDDDGAPEILLGAIVYDAEGCLLDATRGVVDLVSGHIPVAADLNQDGVVELATGDQLLEWRAGKLEPAASFTGSHARGFTAVADFGDFGEGPGVADIVVISAGTARIENVLGQVVFGPFTVPGLAHGGPPTIGDFDGDGEPEFAAAGASVYAVLDPECDVDPLPVSCEARGVRWSKPSQDLTSNVTGSAVFDFEGDGAAEAVYADECFLRIYDGASGAVKWSIARPSGTANEYPLVADVDGDFHSEIVVTHDEWPSGCTGADPLFPPATFEMSHGVFVYASSTDGWAGSRSVWNQHAYSVTNIADDGSVPRTREWTPNWTVPGLDNFRQNLQPGVAPLAAADLTLSCRVAEPCSEDGVALACDVCNRGAQGVDAGLEVSFETSDAEEPFCRELTDSPILPGVCVSVTCTWTEPPRDTPVDLTVRADSAQRAGECFEQNNLALLPDFSCR